MKKFLKKKLNNEKGMTLIELLAVIVILAIIAAIAIPAIGNIIDNSRVGAIKSDALNYLNATDLYVIDYPEDSDGTVTQKELVDGGYIDDEGSFKRANVESAGFTITLADKTIGLGAAAAVGTVGKIKVEFTGASKKDINGYANNKRGLESNVNAGEVTTEK